MVPGSRGGVLAASLAFALALAGAWAPARADLSIVPTYDSSISGDPNAAAIEGSINAAISALESRITNSITVSVYIETGPGLGSSLTGLVGESYFDYYNALKANATSAAQLTALASLGPPPTSQSSPTPVGVPNMAITTAQARALGFTADGAPQIQGPDGKFYDSIITVNTSITSPPGTLNGSTFGLQSVAAHELNEVLGIGGNATTLGSGNATSFAGPLDLFRYSAPGQRSFTSSASATSYFSIDGGATVISYFNQNPNGDLGDWLSNPIPNGFGPQVQDAFGVPGTDPALGNSELTALNVIGYGLSPSVVPEPATVVILSQAIALAGGLAALRRLKTTREAAHRSS